LRTVVVTDAGWPSTDMPVGEHLRGAASAVTKMRSIAR
jgi:hypothetical protein